MQNEERKNRKTVMGFKNRDTNRAAVAGVVGWKKYACDM